MLDQVEFIQFTRKFYFETILHMSKINYDHIEIAIREQPKFENIFSIKNVDSEVACCLLRILLGNSSIFELIRGLDLMKLIVAESCKTSHLPTNLVKEVIIKMCEDENYANIIEVIVSLLTSRT